MGNTGTYHDWWRILAIHSLDISVAAGDSCDRHLTLNSDKKVIHLHVLNMIGLSNEVRWIHDVQMMTNQIARLANIQS